MIVRCGGTLLPSTTIVRRAIKLSPLGSLASR